MTSSRHPVRQVTIARNLGVRGLEREIHSPPFTAEGKCEWICTSTPPVYIADKHKCNFLFTIHWIALKTHGSVAALGFRIPCPRVWSVIEKAGIWK